MMIDSGAIYEISKLKRSNSSSLHSLTRKSAKAITSQFRDHS